MRRPSLKRQVAMLEEQLGEARGNAAISEQRCNTLGDTIDRLREKLDRSADRLVECAASRVTININGAGSNVTLTNVAHSGK